MTVQQSQRCDSCTVTTLCLCNSYNFVTVQQSQRCDCATVTALRRCNSHNAGRPLVDCLKRMLEQDGCSRMLGPIVRNGFALCYSYTKSSKGSKREYGRSALIMCKIRNFVNEMAAASELCGRRKLPWHCMRSRCLHILCGTPSTTNETPQRCVERL